MDLTFAVHGQRSFQRTVLQHDAERQQFDLAPVRQERPQPLQRRHRHPLLNNVQQLQDSSDSLCHSGEAPPETDGPKVSQHRLLEHIPVDLPGLYGRHRCPRSPQERLLQPSSVRIKL